MIQIVRADFGTSDFAACLAIRTEVFVNEQNVPVEEELDSFDAIALHILALVGGQPIGTARAVEKALGHWKIGRVAVRVSHRQQGIGAALMQAIESACHGSHFTLSAQTHALSFYKRLGYEAEGTEFFEAGIPHFLMHKAASSS